MRHQLRRSTRRSVSGTGPLQVTSWLRLLAETAPDTDDWIDCPQPGVAQLLFEKDPRLRITNTLWRADWGGRDLAPSDVSRRVADLVRNLGSPNHDLGLVKLRAAKSLRILGGYVNGICRTMLPLAAV